jgi:NADH dehydrogenase FAD-containing subunit
MPKKKLFIVGGGWLGVELAQKIEGNKKARAMFDITCIDKKKVLYNNISGLQACVEPDLVGGMLVSKENACKFTKHVHAEVEAILPPGAEENTSATRPAIKLKARKTPVECDYVVIATGTQYTFPGKVPWWIGTSACTRLYEKIRDSIAKAESVTVVGGGPVGCELAGAIASAFPEKAISLIHKGAALCSAVRGPDLGASQGSQKTKTSGAEGNGKYCKPKSLAKIKSELENVGVKVVLNEEVIVDEAALKHGATHRVASVANRSIEKAQNGELDEQKVAAAGAGEGKDGSGDGGDALADAAPTIDASLFVGARNQAVAAGDAPPKKLEFMSDGISDTIKTVSGKEFKADLVFFCTGPIANSDPYKTHFETDYRGRVCCDDQLRVFPAGQDSKPLDCVFTMGDCCGTRFDDEQNMTAGHVHRATVMANLMAVEAGTPAKMKAYKPNPYPALVLFMGRKAGAAELFGKSYGKWLTHNLKTPEFIAGMAWGNLNAGKPPKSNWARKKKGCCCCTGTRSAVVTYAPTDGDDDW